jgi:hypothetical protein
MNGMFYGATAFNNGGTALATTTGGWNTSLVTDMSEMFQSASHFNNSLGSWSIPFVAHMTNMLDSTAITPVNYDATLAGWAGQSVQHNVSLGAAGIYYLLSAVASKTTLTSSPNSWIISDAGEVITTVSINNPPSDGQSVGGSFTPTFTTTSDGTVFAAVSTTPSV